MGIAAKIAVPYLVMAVEIITIAARGPVHGMAAQAWLSCAGLSSANMGRTQMQ